MLARSPARMLLPSGRTRNSDGIECPERRRPSEQAARPLNTAVSEDLLAFNPGQSVRARNPSSKLAGKRQPFTPDQVHRIFEELKGEQSDFSWIVRLLAYHGMRSGEVCQLRCDDISTLQGTAVIRVHDLYGPLKNKASVRDVPIHPSCIGIVDAAKEAAMNYGAEAWLFPAIPRRKRRPADWFHHYASLFLREKAFDRACV